MTGKNIQKKYINTILYICEHIGGKIEGKKKLAKLLYFVDFDMFEYKESMKTITGDTYTAKQMGPVPNKFNEIISEMTKKGILNKEVVQLGPEYLDMEVFSLKNERADMTLFNEDEKFILQRVVDTYGRLNGKQLENISHAEAPWNGVDLGSLIPFELSFYRETQFN